MARGRHRFKVGVRAPFVKAEYEWIGFRSGTVQGNLDTTIIHEIIPPIADNTVGIQSFTVYRTVGSIFIMHQGGIVTGDGLGLVLGVEDVGADQTSDNPFLPLTTDVDAMHHKGIMWWWTGVPTYGTSMADSDETGFEIPIDVKVKRIVDKRQRFVLTATATATARLRALVNIRCLIRETRGS